MEEDTRRVYNLEDHFNRLKPDMYDQYKSFDELCDAFPLPEELARGDNSLLSSINSPLPLTLNLPVCCRSCGRSAVIQFCIVHDFIYKQALSI